MNYHQIKTGCELAAAIRDGLAITDCGVDCFDYSSKEIENAPHYTNCKARSCRFGSGELTGRRCWAYAGAGYAMELQLENGSFVWAKDIVFQDQIPEPKEWEEVPTQEIPDPIAAFEYFGVRLPRSVPFFDCRSGDDFIPKTPWGATLFSSERAAFAMGLRPGPRIWNDSGIINIEFHFDSRNRRLGFESARIIRKLRKHLAEAWKNYRKAGRNPAKEGEGGSCYYKPAFIHLANFGAGVSGYRNEYNIKAFRV